MSSSQSTSSSEYTFEQTASILSGMLSEDIIDFYNYLCSNNALSQALIAKLKDWVLSPNGNNLFTLVDPPQIKVVIHFILDTEIQDLDISEALTHQRELKKSRRGYLFRKIKSEVGVIEQTSKNGSHMIADEWAALSNPLIRERKYTSKEEFYAARLAEVTDWYNAPVCYLFKFPYFSTISAKKQVEAFLIDLQYEVLELIYKNFYKNVFGFVTKTPDMMLGSNSGAPVVSWASSAMDLKYETKPDRVIVYETVAKGTASDTRIVVAEVLQDCSTEEKANAAVMKVKDDFEKGVLTRTFDTEDFAILTAIYNNMDLKSANGDTPVHISAKSLVSDIHSDIAAPRKRVYVDSLSRLNKIASMHIISSSYDNKGKLLSAGTVSFYDLGIRIEGRDGSDGSVTVYQTTDGNLSPGSSIFANLDMEDFNNMVIDVYPSLWMREQWREGVHDVVYSQSYRQIASQKGKFLFQLIHKERMRIYPETGVDITIKFFRDNLRSNQSTTRLKKEILEELSYFKDNHIMVADYIGKKGSVHIDFLPFTQTEHQIYKTDDIFISE